MANANSLADKAIKTRNILRQMCRTDIYSLCKVLGYDDVSPKVHQPIVDIMPKLLGGKDVDLGHGRFKYKPHKEIWQMSGPREFLIMYPRGHL